MQLTTRHLFQSEVWERYQKSIGKPVFRNSGDGWSFLAIEERAEGSLGRLVKRLTVPYGPTAVDEKALSCALMCLEDLARQRKVDYVRVEPVLLNGATLSVLDSYSKLPKAFQPEWTHVVNLQGNEEDIIAKFSATTRRTWRQVSENGQTFRTTYDPSQMHDFLLMMRQTEKRTGATLRGDGYLKKLMVSLAPHHEAGLTYVVYEGKPVGGSLFIDDQEGKTRYYMYTGTYDEARPIRANSTLVTHMMLDAKAKGLQFFDLFGVAPPDAGKEHRWAGISEFKRSYGGEDLQFSGTWEKPIRKIKYSTMKLARKLVGKR